LPKDVFGDDVSDDPARRNAQSEFSCQPGNLYTPPSVADETPPMTDAYRTLFFFAVPQISGTILAWGMFPVFLEDFGEVEWVVEAETLGHVLYTGAVL